MCGIAGIYQYSPLEMKEEHISRLYEALKNRGPDGRGHVLHQGSSQTASSFLLHTRLAIIDLSDRATQPMSSADGRYHIVFNGEIYNYQDLRQRLASRGHSFRTTSDTEVLLYLYVEYQERMFDLIDGMFSFAIVDQVHNRLFAACDRFGEKPFYYRLQGGTFCFASTLKALLLLTGGSPEVNLESVTSFLCWGNIAPDQSMFKNIHRILPGHSLRMDRDGVSTRPYWQAKEGSPVTGDEAGILAHTQGLLEKSIEARLVADVPVGILLSGGVDSSLITALASRHKEKLTTFTVRYQEDPERDEGEYARLVAAQFHTDHHEVWLKDDSFAKLQDMVVELGEPVRNFNIFATYALTREISKSVKVLLGGDGADEIGGGYPWSDIPFEKVTIQKNGGNLGSHALWDIADNVDWLKNKSRQTVADLYGKYSLKTIFMTEECRQILREDLLPIFNSLQGFYYQGYFEQHRELNLFNQIIRIDKDTHLLQQILQPADRISMMNGVEMRLPFLNHQLWEYCFNVPVASRFNRDIRKYLLKRMAESFFPQEFVHRRKLGLYAPFGDWMRGNRTMREQVREIILSQRCIDRGYIRNDVARNLFNFDKVTDQNLAHRYILAIWVLLVLELWHRSYIDNETVHFRPS